MVKSRGGEGTACASRRTIRGLRGIAGLVAVLVALSACETSPGKLGDASSSSLRKMLMRSAAAARNSNDYVSAVSTYRTLYAQDPDDVEIVLGLAQNLRYTGKLDEARQVLLDSLKKKPDDPRILAERGKVALAAGKPDQAVRFLKDAIRIDPKTWQFHSSLGIANDLLGRPEEARRSYETALALSPENVTVLNNLALSRTLAGDLTGGIATLVALTGRPGITAQIRQNLALLYALKGEISQTEALARRDLPEGVAENNISYYRLLGPPAGGATPDGGPSRGAAHPLRDGTIR